MRVPLDYKISSISLLQATALVHGPEGREMLKAPEHQVAGHDARDGVLGPLVDGTGRFYKPFQGGERGASELAFYTSFSSDPRVPTHVRRFFPGFHGTQLLPASDGSSSSHPHLVLEDLVSSFSSPSLMDIKIGSRTWAPSFPEDYIDKCLKKDRETSSVSLGFRVSGVQIHYPASSSGFWRSGRKEVKNYTAVDVRRVLKRFVSSSPESEDCSLAAVVYGGSDGVLAQLLELKAWFEDQTLFHFYSASVILVYGKDGLGIGDERSAVKVKLVDFAHVVEGDGVIDHNFLGGLCSVIKFISEVLTDPDESKKTQLSLENGV